MSPDPQILLIRQSSLGDIVLTTPVLDALKNKWPGCRVDYLVKAAYGPILEGDRRINRLLLVETPCTLTGLVRLIREIRRRRYDLVIDLHKTARSVILGLLSGAGRRLTYRKKARERRLFVLRHRPPNPPFHTVDLYLAPLERIGIEPVTTRPRLLSAGGEPGETGTGQARIGLLPGAASPTKMWPVTHFAELARRLKEGTGCRVEAVLPPGESELAGKIGESAGRWLDRIVFPDLGELPRTLAGYDTVVSNDSGPMHVAVAVGTPVVALFGPTHPGLGFSPLGELDRVIHLGLPCSPCSLHGDKPCKLERRACLEDISPESVAAAVGEILHEKKNRKK